MDYEAMRPARARAMFEFLVRRQVWLGCRDWESLSQEVKDAFTDMVALLAEPASSDQS